MKIAFKVRNYVFYAKFNETPAAQEIIKCLPSEKDVEKTKERVCFHFDDIQDPMEGNIPDIREGEIVYYPQNKCLCIFLGSESEGEGKEFDLKNKGIVVGNLLTSLAELKHMELTGKVEISSVKDREYYGDRILSQKEIDELVKELLEKKRQITS